MSSTQVRPLTDGRRHLIWSKVEKTAQDKPSPNTVQVSVYSNYTYKVVPNPYVLDAVYIAEDALEQGSYLERSTKYIPMADFNNADNWTSM
jgi:hypothetical protein